MPNGSTDPFLDRFRCGDLRAFFPLAPGDTEAALHLARPIDRTALAAALRTHAERLGAPEAALRSLERLAHPESRVVVTGQQTGLLLGPMFTLTKAFTALRLASELDSEDRPVVPLFWLASQDHDCREIDHAYLLDFDERLHRVEVPLPDETPSGRIPLGEGLVGGVIERLSQIGGPRANLDRAAALLERTAEVSSSFADWFGAQLYDLLGAYGLVLVDPLEPSLAALAAPILQRELDDPGVGVAAVVGAGDRLRALGFPPQLGRGADATNLFVERRDGQSFVRTALRRLGADFVAGGVRYTAAELKALLDDDPTRITPAAGLRPIVQDAILPTAATVVGPGELRYFAQLGGVYRHHGVATSLVWPRAEATLIEPPVRRILERYGLGAARFAADPEGALERVALELSGNAGRFAAASATLEREGEALLEAVAAIDPTLSGAVVRARERIERTLTKLRGQGAAAVARRDEVMSSQFDRLRSHLLPGGEPQERTLSPYSAFLKFGVRPVLARFESLPSSGRHDLTIV